MGQPVSRWSATTRLSSSDFFPVNFCFESFRSWTSSVCVEPRRSAGQLLTPGFLQSNDLVLSRSWNELALDGSNWQAVDLFPFQRDISSALIQRLSLRTGGFLHALQLRGCRSLTDDALDHLTRSCPNLQTLVLNECVLLTDATCVSIASQCDTLIHLDLSGLKITDASLEALSSSPILTSRLKHLDLSYCPRLTSAGLVKLLTPVSVQLPPRRDSGHRNSTSSCRSDHMSRPLGHLSFFAARVDADLATDASIALLAASASTSLQTLMLHKCRNLTGRTEVIACTFLTSLLLLCNRYGRRCHRQ